MGRLVGVLIMLMVGLVVAGFVLAHFGFVVLLALGLVFLGRHLQRHGG
jgi:hypothetical protein